jgi:hypothetical protein
MPSVLLQLQVLNSKQPWSVYLKVRKSTLQRMMLLASPLLSG